jgi:hypothetical protein
VVCHDARSVRSNWARGQYFTMRYMALDRVGNRHAFTTNIPFGTYGSSWRCLTRSPVLYTFWSPWTALSCVEQTAIDFCGTSYRDAKIGILRAILCTAGLEAFWCLLGFFTMLQCEYDIGGFRLFGGIGSVGLETARTRKEGWVGLEVDMECNIMTR